MLMKKQISDPKPLVRIAMVFLALSAAWPRLIPYPRTLGTDVVDGIKGLLLGVAIGLIIWASRVGGFRRPK